MMTENQWPQTPNPAISDPYGASEVGAEDTYTTSGTPGTGGTSKKEAAKEEASNVAGQAASAAQGVAQTAKEEVANVASEAKSSAQDLLSQAKSGLTSQAGTQQQKAAEGIRTISSQLHSMAEAPDQQGVASDLIRQAAQRSESVASWLENKQPGDLLGEVQRFARNRPGTFLLLAAGAGVLAGRLTRGLTAGATESQTGSRGLAGQYSSPYGDQYTEGYVPAGGTIPPPPVQLPGPATTTAGYDGGAPGTTYPSGTSTTSPLGSPELVEEEPWSGNRTAEDPLGDRSLADEPMAGDPLTRDRSRDGQSGGL
jgi:cell division septum initiation protein DivIVA